MSLSTVLAKALFDNAAESPEELAFRKGDILMVLEQEQSGGPGWWLCSLHGRQGIAPANRLRLLQTSVATAGAAGSELRRGVSEDSVYLSPGPSLLAAEDADGVYRSPTSGGVSDGLYQSPGGPAGSRPGELRRADGAGGRPRSHSSSGTRPRPDWDGVGMGAVAGRPRSPSLRGRESGMLYQTPTSPGPAAAQYHRQPAAGALLAPDSVYLSPTGVPRSAEEPDDSTYLVPRETTAAAGHSDGCYLVPRGTPLAGGDEVYQTPTGGQTAAACGLALANGTPNAPQPKPSPPPGQYQTPTPVGAGGVLHRIPAAPSPAGGAQAPSPRPHLKGVASSPAMARGKPGMATAHRGSPLLVRAAAGGQGRVPGSPNFARKPPPPAPPVRGVTRKDPPPAASPQLVVGTTNPPAAPAASQEGNQQKGVSQHSEERVNGGAGLERKNNSQNKKGENQDYEDPTDDQVYDTPPSGRWQQRPPALGGDDGIYDTPRTVPSQADSESEVYDVPTLALNASTSDLQHGSAADEVDDVYSVPTLPGLPLVPGEHVVAAGLPVSGPEKRASESDCGIYDMPALTVTDVLTHSSSSSSSSTTRRLSVSSNGSGDVVHWRVSLSGLVQAVLNVATCPPSTLSSRELATQLAEILTTWKASHPAGAADPPLQQTWTRLSDLLPALTAAGAAPPSDGILSLVQRALEESALLLQAQSRPRLPSQDSLSRRPLPALPVTAVDGGKAATAAATTGGGMGSRKGSWIQERPLPPTPQPAFPLPPVPPSSVTLTVGLGEDDDDPTNEYAGISLTPTPAPLPVGDSVGYVKLQGKPEPPPNAPLENGQTITTEPRLSPSPPMPVSLSLEDSELLSFYSSQSLAHLSCLADSIDVLYSSVQGNQPPRIFVARGKSLIVTAHKLVFIGDTLSRLLTSPDLRAKVTTSGGRLCQALKTVVVATKGAAQNYPSVSATQEMVDRVAELSQQAAGFSGLLQRLAEIS